MTEVEKEVIELLKKHNAHLEVEFAKDSVMGNTVLVYKIIVVENTNK